jgi:hypothetical protein
MSAPPPPPRPFTRAQALENAAFLAELRRTGNAREAARRLGAHRAKFTRRRARHAGFAAQWDAALVLADARLNGPADRARPHTLHRVRGRLQLRPARAEGLDQAARTRFLTALGACANVRLAARAAGFSHAAFYHHRRRDPAFAREWQLALETGYLQLQAALLAGGLCGFGADDDWQRNEPPAIPPMTVAQALQLLYLHQKEARLLAEPEPLRRRRGETREARVVRLSLIYEARLQRDRELFDRAQAARLAARTERPSPLEPPPPAMPDLGQVTGWSKATGRPPHDASRALFGGWRIGGERQRGTKGHPGSSPE